MGCAREYRASAVGGKKEMVIRGEESREGKMDAGSLLYLVKLIANNNLHDFRWDIVLKLL
jgi:hypothetical protein